MKDLIDRQEAIRTLAKTRGVGNRALDKLRELPSAQPDHFSEVTKKVDLIDRQAAIDAMATWDWQELYLPIHFKQLLEELPSAQPETHACDLVSRQAVLDTLEWKWAGKAAIDAIKALPSAPVEALELFGISEQLHAQPERRWIPCSDREPEIPDEYRITWTTSSSKKRFIGDAEYEITGEWDEEHGRFKGEWLLDDYIKAYPNVKVLAWKPLEEPYREEGEE